MGAEVTETFILAESKDKSYYDFLRQCKDLAFKLEEITIDDLERKSIDLSLGILILFSQNPRWLDFTLTGIRKRFTTSLLPILVISSPDYENENRLADDVLAFPTKNKSIEEKLQSCISISQRLRSLNSILDSLNEDRKRAVALLRFIYTRNKMRLEPKQHKLSLINYYYPPANIFFNTNPGEEREKLEMLERMGMLTSELVDKVHLCPSCLITSIRLRELCPNCDSIEIEKIIAMHHEYCSYTGDEEDFKKPQLDIYVCPKCKEEISSDEAKKSKFPAFLCQLCGNIFKEPKKKFICPSCKNDYSYEDLSIKDIKAYSITLKGIRAAEDGILYDFSERRAILEREKAERKEILQFKNSNIITSGRLFLKNIGIKSTFKYLTVSYLILYSLFLFVGVIIYLAAKASGLVSSEINISQINILLDKWNFDFLNNLGSGNLTFLTLIIMGFLLSLVWGLLGILAAWIANIMLEITGGIELRFESFPSKYLKNKKAKRE